jgi:hypothetical protein
MIKILNNDLLGFINSSKVLKNCFYNVRFLSNQIIIIDNIQKYNYLFITDENYLRIPPPTTAQGRTILGRVYIF